MASKEVLFKLRFVILILSLITLDLASKAFAEAALIYGQSEQTILPFIDLLLIYNSGIAFGIFNSANAYSSYILLVITIMISLYLLWMIVNESNAMKKYALSIITAGAFGNIIDRAVDNKVTDFLHLEMFNVSFFIFNFADAFITTGAILIIYFEIVHKLNNE
jgi:signal peptidase II